MTDVGEVRQEGAGIAKRSMRGRSGALVPAQHAESIPEDVQARHGEMGSSPTACRADRYLVVLHVDPTTLSAGTENGRSELEDGTALPRKRRTAERRASRT